MSPAGSSPGAESLVTPCPLKGVQVRVGGEAAHPHAVSPRRGPLHAPPESAGSDSETRGSVDNLAMILATSRLGQILCLPFRASSLGAAPEHSYSAF
jgi:hypothetical protein